MITVQPIGDFKEQWLAIVRLSKQGRVGWLVPTATRVKRYRSDFPDNVIITTSPAKLPTGLSSLVDQGLARRYYQLPGGAVVARLVPEARWQQAVKPPPLIYLASPTGMDVSGIEVKERSSIRPGSTLTDALRLTWENSLFQYEGIQQLDEYYRSHYHRWVSNGDGDTAALNRLAALLSQVSQDRLKGWAVEQKLNPDKLSEVVRYYHWLLKGNPGQLTEPKGTLIRLGDAARLAVTPLHRPWSPKPSQVLFYVTRIVAGVVVIDIADPMSTKSESISHGLPTTAPAS